MASTAQEFGLNTGGDDQAFGTDIRLLSPGTVPGGVDNTTRCDFGTSGGNKDISVRPLVTSSAAGQFDTNYGWAMNESDVDSTATAKRRVKAGTAQITGTASTQTGTASATTIHAALYRVAASPGFTRTLIASGDSGSFNPAAAPLTSAFTINITIPDDVLLEADETLMVALYMNGNSLAISGRTVSLRLGTTTGTETELILPTGLRTFHPKSTSVTASGVAAAERLLQASRTASATASGVVSAARALTLFRTASATATGVVTADRVLTIRRTASATATGVASVVKQINKTITATASGVVSATKKIPKTVTATATAVASAARQLSLARTASVTASGVASAARVLTVRRTATAVATAVADVKAKLDTDIIARMTGGGATVVKRIFHIFDG